MGKKKEIRFPNLLAELVKKNETQIDLAKLLDVEQATISRKMTGKSEWTISEIETICEHFQKGYYELFK